MPSFSEVLGNGAGGEPSLTAARSQATLSSTPSAMWSIKKRSARKFSPCQFMREELDLLHLCSRPTVSFRETQDLFLTDSFLWLITARVNVEFNFSITPSHARPRLICEGLPKLRSAALEENNCLGIWW